jgi:ectoine hydroxylase-related dioxygenase (phytanoyl-CoA dioxygenase family)
MNGLQQTRTAQVDQITLASLDEDGCVLIRNVFETEQIADWLRQLDEALRESRDEAKAIHGREGTVYAARNVLDWFPVARTLWREPTLTDLLTNVLGERFGLVRALYFDKPPERTWALPWHQDLTIAVREHAADMGDFTHPTRKAGVPHVEAPLNLLERMLTLRVHLDDVTDENGPLRVLPGSHRDGKSLRTDLQLETAIHARAGDVLAMRPLLAHASGASTPGTVRHRRILHFEFAANPELPHGLHWHTFVPGSFA